MTFTGSEDPADPRTLGDFEYSPWAYVELDFDSLNSADPSGVDSQDPDHGLNSSDVGEINPTTIESIVFRSPTGISLPADSAFLFAGPTSLTSMVDLGSVNTEGVTDTYSMFASVSALEQLDLSGWDTTHLEGETGSAGEDAMEDMFDGTFFPSSLTLGTNSWLSESVNLLDVTGQDSLTGKWVRIGPDAPADQEWWRGTSEELEKRARTAERLGSTPGSRRPRSCSTCTEGLGPRVRCQRKLLHA